MYKETKLAFPSYLHYVFWQQEDSAPYLPRNTDDICCIHLLLLICNHKSKCHNTLHAKQKLIWYLKSIWDGCA